jgi:hypothetical protein
MSAAMLMLAVLQAPSAAPDGNTDDAILVLGQKADRLRVTYHYDGRGELTQCRVTRSSGDSDVDRLWCEAARRCAAEWIGDSRNVRACIRPRHGAMLKDLADSRKRARSRL